MDSNAYKTDRKTTCLVGLPDAMKGSIGMELVAEEDIADDEGPGSLTVVDAQPLVHSTMSM